MNPQAVFDKFLLKDDMEGAFNWVTEKLAWDPESIHLRGMTAFAFRLNDQFRMARMMAEDVLKEDPKEEWALATVFSTIDNMEAAFEQFSFFDENGFCLSHDWIGRFYCLGKKDEARKVIYCLSRFGSPKQKALLSEEWLVEGPPVEFGENQLEMEFEKIPSPFGKMKNRKNFKRNSGGA